MAVESVTLNLPAKEDPTPKEKPANVSDGSNGSKVVTMPAPAGEKTERPAWLPEKFATPEDLAKSYAELEKAAGKKEVPAKEVPAVSKTSAIDFNALTTEYEKNGGKLTDASLASLKELGFSKADVDTYIAGRQAQVASVVNAANTAAGGEDNLKAAMAWANVNLPAGEKEAFNTATATNDPARVKLAVQGLMASYTAAVGKDGNRIRGGELGGEGSGVQPFANLQQQIAAQSDKRYAEDPAFRQNVINRIAAGRARR